MTYKKVILDESILDFDSWLPQEAIDALTEIVYDKADEFVNQEKTKAYQKDILKGGNKMNKDLNGKWKCLLVLKDFTHKSMYLFDTREEAIEHGYEAVKKFNENVKMGNTSDEPIMMFYVGQIIRPDVPFDVENFIAQVQDSAYEDACECAEGYLDDVTEEHKKELEKLILGWFTEHNYLPTWHRLHNIEITII